MTVNTKEMKRIEKQMEKKELKIDLETRLEIALMKANQLGLNEVDLEWNQVKLGKLINEVMKK